jgi:hypothetical protein
VQVVDRSGKPTGEYKLEASTAAKCLELLGKHQGMFGALSPAEGPTGELAAMFAAVRARGRPGLPGLGRVLPSDVPVIADAGTAW